MKTIKEVISKSAVKFGTSGARGLVTEFTTEVCTAFTISFLDAMKKSFEFKKVAVAMDNRPSSPEISSIICGAIKAYGYEVDFYGVIPTPALALQAMTDEIPSIMITGSQMGKSQKKMKYLF
jgi:phosphomannomutase